jgi:hypothetical protein
MLEDCCPGYGKEPGKKQEFWRVYWRGKTFWRLPTGRHGRRQDPEVQAGHVRKMCNLFGILECAKKHLELLR